jgi:tetratricopeptide (TPR) repeat protein
MEATPNTNKDLYNKFQYNLISFLNVEELLKISSDSKIFTEQFYEILTRFKNLSADIISAYNFSENFPKPSYLSEIFFILQNINETENLNNIVDKVSLMTLSKIQEKLYSEEEIFASIIILLYLFLQQSIYGSSFFYIKESEKTDFHKDLSKFENNLIVDIENKTSGNEIFNKQIIEHLSLCGESPYKNMKLSIFFILVHHILLRENLFQNSFPHIVNLWKIRVLFLHNKMLRDPINDIKEQIEQLSILSEQNISELFEYLKTNQIVSDKELKLNLGMLNLEKSYFLLKYYKYKDAEDTIEKSKENFELKISLSGRLGRRTKYQEFDTAILVVESESSTLSNKDKESYNEGMTTIEIEDENKPSVVSLDSENPLLEKPNITDETFLKSTELSLHDQMYVTALINYLKYSLPDEDLLRETILTYAIKSLEKSNDWLVYSKLLLQKSLAEDRKSKTIERSLLQIQSLCDQYNDRSPTPWNRLKFCFTIDYPFIWNLKKHYAEMFMNYGAVLTAFDIFQELGMYEECINCLYVAGKTQRAEEFAQKILKEHEDPGVYCVMGEIKNDESLFHKALEVSKFKYTRAYRCLAKFYMVQNKFDEAIKYYEKALEINPLFPGVWFSLGCLYLRLKNWKEATRAFSKSVQMDDSNSEGWANLGLSFSQMGKDKEALKCLEEGFKRSRTNWRICENLMLVAIDSKELNKLIYAINNLFNLDKYDRIKPSSFYALIQIFVNRIPELSEDRIVYFKTKIYDIFEKFSIKDGVTPEIWDLYAFYIEAVEVEVEKNKISEEEKSGFYIAVMEVRLKQARGLMIKDTWEKDEQIIEKLQKCINKIKTEISRLKNENYEKEVKVFVNNVESKIERFYKVKEFDSQNLLNK